MSHPPLFLSTTMTARKSQQGFCYRQVVAKIGYFSSQEQRKGKFVLGIKNLSKDKASEVLECIAKGSCRISTRNNLANSQKQSMQMFTKHMDMAYLPWEECESFDDFQNLFQAFFFPLNLLIVLQAFLGFFLTDCCKGLLWASKVLVDKAGAAGKPLLLAGPLPVTTCKCVLEKHKWSC